MITFIHMNKKTKSPSSLPWASIFHEIGETLKKPSKTLVIFFILFFMIAIPSFPDFEEWRTLSPLKLWLFISIGLIWLFFSYFNSVIFILWASAELKGKRRNSFISMIKSANSLLIPLTLLSIRGSFLTVFGLIAFLIPGCYFMFKYELASVCLIVEGWQDNHPPVKRAEEMIAGYKLSLLPLAILLLIGWSAPIVVEWLLKMNSLENSWISRVFVAAIEALLTIATTLLTTQATISALKTLKTSET